MTCEGCGEKGPVRDTYVFGFKVALCVPCRFGGFRELVRGEE